MSVASYFTQTHFELVHMPQLVEEGINLPAWALLAPLEWLIQIDICPLCPDWAAWRNGRLGRVAL